MSRSKKLVILLLVIVLSLISIIPIYAASNSQDGVTISVSTDRQKYSRNENISVTVDVHNANAFPIEGVTVETHTPSGYNFIGDVGTRYMASLGANEAFQMSVSGNTINLMNVNAGTATQTGDHNGAFLWCVLLVLTLVGTMTLGIMYRKNSKGMFSLLLCMMILAGMLPANVLNLSATNSNPVQTVSAYETIEVDGKQIEVGASVSFQFPGTDDEVTESDNIEYVTPSTPEDIESSEAPSDNEGGDTPGSSEGSETPGGNEGGETPGGSEGSETPGGNEGGETPGGSEDSDTPGGNEGGDTPGGNEGGETPGTTQAINILTGNVGFETGTGNWSKSMLQTWSVTQSKAYSRSGEASLICSVTEENATATDATMSYNGNRENLEPNTEYVMLAWVRTEESKPLQNVTEGARTGIRVYLKSTDAVKTSNESPYIANTEGMWQRVLVEFTTKQDVENPTMTAYLKFAAGTYGNVYVDDVAIYKKSEMDLSTPDKEADKGNMLVGAYPDNILTGNTGFETGTGNWSKSMLQTWSAEQNKGYSRSGEASLLCSVSQGNVTASDVTMSYSGSRENLEPNTEYVMMAWVKTESDKPLQNITEGARTGIRVYLKSTDAVKTSNEGPYVADTEGKWQRTYVEFKTKEDVQNPSMTAYLKFAAGTYGNVYVDDVAIYKKSEVNWNAPEREDGYTGTAGGGSSNTPGTGDEGSGDVTEDLVPIGDNLFVNGSFEEFNPDGTLVGSWVDHSGGNWAESSKIQVVDGGYDGAKSVRIKTSDGSNPCFYQADTNVIGGEDYFVTCMVKTTEMLGTGPRIKIEYYDAEGTNFESSQSEYFGNTNGEWKKKGLTFKAPTGTRSVKIYLRLYGAGEVYYDDVQLYKYGEAEKLYFEGDTFFYTEWLNGTVGVRLNTDALELTGTEVVDISLKDPETNAVLGTPMTGVATATLEGDTVSALKPNYTFDVSLLANKGQKYVIEATLYDTAGGTALGTSAWPVYRYDRPTMIKESGEIVDPNTGTTIIPVWGYHVYNNAEMQQAAKAAGINIIQGSGSTVESAIQYLDLAQQNGLYATVLLYSGMKAAGSEGQIENTQAIVNAVKDHPALFGYLVMDEPYLHMSDPYDDLVNSYKIIRDIDPVHPVIIQDVESTGSVKYTAATSDILVLHHYACNVVMMPNKTDYGMMGTTRVISRMLEDLNPNTSLTKRKVVHYLGQSFGEADKATASRYYLPTIDEAKSMIYQALMEGMEGVGYYSFTESGWKVTETDLYPGLVSFAENELAIANDAYIADRYRGAEGNPKKYTMLNEDRNETSDVWWETFKDAEGNWYVIALNMTEDNKAVTIPLTSTDNTARIDTYTKVLVGGTGTADVENESGTLTIALGAHGTAMYKLTPIIEESIYDSLTKLNELTSGDVTWGLYKEETSGVWYVQAKNNTEQSQDVNILLNSNASSKESLLKYTTERIGGSEEVIVTNKLGYFSATIPAQAAAEYKLTPVILNNILSGSNIGFETGNKTGWSITQSAYASAVTVSNTYSRTGRYSLLCDISEETGGNELTVKYTGALGALEDNTSYTMQMWVYTEQDNPLKTKNPEAPVTGVRAYVKANTTNFTKQTNEGTCKTDTAGNWQPVTVEFTTKSVQGASITVFLKLVANTYGKVWIDDVAIYKSADLQ